MTKLAVTTILAFFALSAGWTSTPEFQSGPDAEVTHDGLTRLDKTVMDVVWAKLDIDPGQGILGSDKEIRGRL